MTGLGVRESSECLTSDPGQLVQKELFQIPRGTTMNMAKNRTRLPPKTQESIQAITEILALAILRKKQKRLGITSNSSYSADISNTSGE